MRCRGEEGKGEEGRDKEVRDEEDKGEESRNTIPRGEKYSRTRQIGMRNLWPPRSEEDWAPGTGQREASRLRLRGAATGLSTMLGAGTEDTGP